MNTIEQELKQKYPDIKFELYLNNKNNTIYLTGFIVPIKMRNQGIGTSFMNDLINLADKYQYTIKLTPSNSYGGNVKRLFDFYKRFGFIRNKGKNRDWTHSEAMYRNPIQENNEEMTSKSGNWESGVTRGKGNPISNIGNWESGLTRGKANPISNTGNWESGLTRGKANPLNESNIITKNKLNKLIESIINEKIDLNRYITYRNDNDIIQALNSKQHIFGWLLPDNKFIEVVFGGHEFISDYYFKNSDDSVNTAIENNWVRISKNSNYIYLDVYDESQIKPTLNTYFKNFVNYILSGHDVTFTIYVLKRRKVIYISSNGISVNGIESNITLDKYLKSNIQTLNENMNIDDWGELESNMTYEILQMIANKQSVKFDLIPKNQYHKALSEFVKYGELMRFPESIIYQWKDLILENISKLSVLTDIAGHSPHFPYDEFYDIFDHNDETGDGEFSAWTKQKYEETGDKEYLEKCNFSIAYYFLDNVKNMDDYLPLFSNGQWVLSDFGLKPLYKLGKEVAENNNPNEIIVLINKILDVTHQRSDLAELFIEGGSKSLTQISNNELNELKSLVKQIIKEEVQIKENQYDFEKKNDYAVNYVYKFYDKNKNFTPLAEPDIQYLAGSISWFQSVAYKDKSYQISFYFSYLTNNKPNITIELLDEDNFSLIKKII